MQSVTQVRMDGTNGKADLRMSMPENVGAFYRSSTKPDGTVLCLGRAALHYTPAEAWMQQAIACGKGCQLCAPQGHAKHT